MLVFEALGKPEYPGKTCRSKGENQQQTQPGYQDLNLGHFGGRRVLTPLRHPLLPAARRGVKNMFILTNNNFARTKRYFVHFFAVIAPLRHETS